MSNKTVLIGFIPGKKTEKPRKTKAIIGNYRFILLGSLKENLEKGLSLSKRSK